MYEFLQYRVCDVMTKDPVHIGPDASLADAMQLFEEHDFNGLPVASDAGELVGFLTKLDVLGAFRFDQDHLFPPYDEIMERRVADVMSRDVRAVTPRAHLTDILSKLVETHRKSLPVVDDRRLVGIISREDVLCGLRRAASGEVATGPI